MFGTRAYEKGQRNKSFLEEKKINHFTLFFISGMKGWGMIYSQRSSQVVFLKFISTLK